MPTVHLTDRFLKSSPPPERGRVTYHDDTDRHLYLRRTSAGAMWYHVGGSGDGGKARWTKLGEWPETGTTEARRLCALEEATASARPSRTLTLGELWDRYMRQHVRGRLKTADEYQRKWDKSLRVLARRRVSSLKRDEIARLHGVWTDKHGPTAANRILAALRSCLSWGVTMSLVETNPAKDIRANRETSKERFLTRDELARLWKALDDEPDRQWADWFKLALFTGARRGSVCAMQWDNVDLGEGVWSVEGEKTKNGDPLRLPLAAPAVEILKRRHANRGSSDYVFPSASASGHVVNPTKAWKRICKRAEIKDVTIHDLRRTLGSWQAGLGTSLQIIGQSLGHKSLAATQIYARLNMDPVRASVDAAVEAMMGSTSEDKSTDADD